MLRPVSFTVAFVCLLLQPLTSFAANGPIRIPGPGEGYEITKNESSRPAPGGYEGRTDTSTLTAVGNTPATMGKKIVARFELGNEIKTCPAADGTSEGKGRFSMTLDYTDRPATGGGGTLRIEMKAEGTYKGQVGDDAWMMNPVNAEIDYTYTQTGTLRDPSGAIATPAGTNAAQHITIPFGVSKDMTPPSFGAFAGGDPTQGKYAEAFGAGTALVYWAGVYYSVAQTKWRQDNTCVKVEFTPPSYSVRIVPSGQTKVTADVKTKSGESVKGGTFQGARAISNIGSVSPAGGPIPTPFTFVAPTQKAESAGFTVAAISRAGVASAQWYAGLGTDWSGRISYTVINSGDQGANELQAWSNTSVSRVTIDVRNGKASATGFTEVHYMGLRRQYALRGGAKTIIIDSSDATDGTLEDSAEGTLEVLNATPGTYSVRVNTIFKKDGKARTQMCNRNTGCTQTDQQIVIPNLPGVDGRLDDPNHLSGTKNDVKTGTGYRGTGTVTSTLTWDLSRQGTAR